MKQPDFTAYKFGNSLIPIDWYICGVKLRPFCLGHYIILEMIDNPLVAAQIKELPINDILSWFFSALLVCAATYEDNIETLNNDVKHKELFDQFCIHIKNNMDAEKDWNIFSKLKSFKDYFDYYMDVPIYNEEHKSKDKTPSGNDWRTTIYLTFKKFGYNESEILNMSFKKLFYIWASYAESEGAIKVWNKMDLESLARQKGLI